MTLSDLARFAIQGADLADVSQVPDLEGFAGTDLSLMGLFLKADVVVKAVMFGLFLASIWSWAIIIDKSFMLGGLKARTRKYEDAFRAGQPVEGMDDRDTAQLRDPMPRVLAAANREWREVRRGNSLDQPQVDAIMVRAQKLMEGAIARESARLERGLGTLATIASASPFIGLFGTVWGIMNAFRGIGAAGNPSLETVAPPIAEALFATGIGLFAAIPALIFYNRFAAEIGAYTERLHDFADEVWVRLSRRLNDRETATPVPAPRTGA
jgi:biopolymer transport protein TolQ